MIRPLSTLVVTALVLLGAMAVGASAHVDVLPTRVVQGEAQEFTVRVPTEREVPTTAISIDFPDQITVFAFAEPPGDWVVEPVRAADGRFSGANFRGGEVPVNGYVDFTFLATPFESGEALFPARQTYADGQVKPWTGPPDEPGEVSPETGPTEPGPSALVVVEPSGSGAPAPDQAQGPSVAPAAPPPSDADEGSGAAIWLGVIAIAISALAMLGVGLLWSTRPARLPPDQRE